MAKKIKEEIHPRKKKPSLPPKYMPNVTALIDVLFLLLLFFLLSSKFRVEEGAIPGTLPTMGQSIGSESASEMQPPIRISVNPSGENNDAAFYEIQGLALQIMDADDLFARLSAKAQSYSDKDLEKVPVIIRARGDTRWGYVVEAFNQAARARFKSVAFAPVGS